MQDALEPRGLPGRGPFGSHGNGPLIGLPSGELSGREGAYGRDFFSFIVFVLVKM